MFSVDNSKVKSEQYFYAGEDGMLKCNIIGNPPPSLEWRKNHRILGLEKEYLWKNVLQEDGTLLIKNISAEDAGEYECKFKQDTGGATKHYRIKIKLFLYGKFVAGCIGCVVFLWYYVWKKSVILSPPCRRPPQNKIAVGPPQNIAVEAP